MTAFAFAPSPLALAADQLRAGQRARAGLQPPAFGSPEQEAFFTSQAPELLYSGWMGAGKSRILCEKAWWLALQHPRAELGIFRKVKASMPATTERTFWTEVVDLQYVVTRNRSENWVDIAQPGQPPSRIWFLGLDPDPITGVPSKVGSLNLDWVGVDEAIELSEADWIMLGGRLRRNAVGYHQLAAATNPASPRHWLKTHFTPPTDDRIYLAASGNRFLPADYRARLDDLGEGVHAQRLGKGLWVAAEGQIYTLPDEQIAEAGQTTWRRVVGGIDWGFTHAFAVEVVGISSTGRMATIAEVYERGLTPSQLWPRLKELRTKLGIETFYADPSEPAYIVEGRAAGLPITEATNDVLPGITAVTQAISAGMTVDPSCTGLLSEIPDYTWARDRSSGLAKDAPVKAGDDAMDAWRYAVMGATTGSGLMGFYRNQLEARQAAGATA